MCVFKYYRPCINCGVASGIWKRIYKWDEKRNESLQDKQLPNEFFDPSIWLLRPYFTWFNHEKAHPTASDITLGEPLFKRNDDEEATLEALIPYLSVCDTCYKQLKSKYVIDT